MAKVKLLTGEVLEVEGEGEPSPEDIQALTEERKEQLKAKIREAAQQYEVDPDLAVAVAEQESGFNPLAIGDGGEAHGLFQLHKGAAKDTGLDPGQRLDPKKNIFAGVAHLATLKSKYGEDRERLLAAYNRGEGEVDRNGITDLGRSYIDGVLKRLPKPTEAPAPPAPEAPQTPPISSPISAQSAPVSEEPVGPPEPSPESSFDFLNRVGLAPLRALGIPHQVWAKLVLESPELAAKLTNIGDPVGLGQALTSPEMRQALASAFAQVPDPNRMVSGQQIVERHAPDLIEKSPAAATALGTVAELGPIGTAGIVGSLGGIAKRAIQGAGPDLGGVARELGQEQGVPQVRVGEEPPPPPPPAPPVAAAPEVAPVVAPEVPVPPPVEQAVSGRLEISGRIVESEADRVEVLKELQKELRDLAKAAKEGDEGAVGAGLAVKQDIARLKAAKLPEEAPIPGPAPGTFVPSSERTLPKVQRLSGPKKLKLTLDGRKRIFDLDGDMILDKEKLEKAVKAGKEAGLEVLTFPLRRKTAVLIFDPKWKKQAERVRELFGLPDDHPYKATASYHRELGEYFGYSDTDIDEFIRKSKREGWLKPEHMDQPARPPVQLQNRRIDRPFSVPGPFEADLYLAAGGDGEALSRVAGRLKVDDERAAEVAKLYAHHADNVEWPKMFYEDPELAVSPEAQQALATQPKSFDEWLRTADTEELSDAGRARKAIREGSQTDPEVVDMLEERARLTKKVGPEINNPEPGESVTPSGTSLDDDASAGTRVVMRDAQQANPSATADSVEAGLSGAGGDGTGSSRGIEFPDPEVEEQLTNRTTKEITDIFASHLDLLADSQANKEGKRLFRQIAEVIRTNGAGVTTEELADLLEKAGTYSGRTLNYLSQLRKVINARAAKGDIAAKKLARKLPGQGKIARLIQIWRGSLTGKIFTGMRNAISQAQTSAWTAMDEAIRDAILKASGSPAGGLPQEIASALKATAGRKFKPNPMLFKFWQERPEVHAELFDQIEEQGFGKIVSRYPGNIINRFQERLYREAAAEAFMRSRLKERGLNPDLIYTAPDQVPADIADEAVYEARRITMSANIEPMMPLMRFMQRWPALYLIQPFPRYAANAALWTLEHQPAAALRLFMPESMLGVGSDPAKRAKVLGQAISGTVMLGMALGLRYSPYAGARWNQIRVGDKDYDMVGFPVAPYLFMADAMKQIAEGRIPNYDTVDAMQGILAFQRLAGVGLLAAQVWSGMNLSNMGEKLAEALGTVVAGYARPLSDLRDLVSGVDEEEAKIRDFRDSYLTRLTGPTLAEVPGGAQAAGLPEKSKPLTGKPIKREFPVYKFMGIKASTFEAVEDEAVKLGVTQRDLLPMTGFADVDRKLAQEMGTMIYEPLQDFIQHPDYKALAYDEKRARFLEFAAAYRKAATAKVTGELAATQPGRLAEMKLKRLGAEPSGASKLEQKKALEAYLKTVQP